MTWSSAVHSVPHVFEQIFAELDLQDRLVAACVCRAWQTVIFSSRVLTRDLTLRLACGNGSLLINRIEVLRSHRRYRNLILAPWSCLDKQLWDELINLLKDLNENCPIEWLCYEAALERCIPAGLFRLGNVFGSLQELELTMTMKSYIDPDWPKAFKHLKRLQSLTMHDGHGEALASVQKYCRSLRKLVLVRFGLTRLLGDVLNFPCLERLTVDELFIPSNGSFRPRRSQVILKRLREVTLLTTDEPAPMGHALMLATLRLPMTVIIAPELKKLRVSYLLRHFIQVGPELPNS